MKLLMVGIDGLGAESLKAMGLPRLSALINRGKRGNPHIDNVVSRGWAEIYSGSTAYETGAFYQIPIKRNGRILPTQKTGAETVAAHIGKDDLLWSKLAAAGLKVGLFTLPTVNVPQESCEFTFPASGAGVFGSSLEGMDVFPPELARLARYSAQNLGFRIGRGAFLPDSVEGLEAWMRDHIAQYFTTLRQTVERCPVDSLIIGTGFLKTYYKFRHILAELSKDSSNIKLKEMLLEVNKDFDFEITKFVSDMSPRHLFIVSDHGLGELRYHVNVNELLRKVGAINYPSVVYRAARYSKNKILNWMREQRQKVNIYPTFDFARSSAFSIGYTDVIYINDQRFAGSPMTDEERFQYSSNLAEKLAKHVKENGYDQFVKFQAIKNCGVTTPKLKSIDPIPLPDIRCFLQEGCVNLQQTFGEVVASNNPYGASEMFKNGFYAQHAGCKTNDTIASYIGPCSDLVELDDLTKLYDSIIRVANQ